MAAADAMREPSATLAGFRHHHDASPRQLCRAGQLLWKSSLSPQRFAARARFPAPEFPPAPPQRVRHYARQFHVRCAATRGESLPHPSPGWASLLQIQLFPLLPLRPLGIALKEKFIASKLVLLVRRGPPSTVFVAS